MTQKNNPGTILTVASATSLLLAAAGSAFAQAALEAPPATPPWETSASVGVTLTRGNSKTFTAVGSILTTRKDKVNEWAFGLDGNYGENSDKIINQSIHGFGQYNHLFSDRFYVFGRADGLHDSIAGVRYRVTLSGGPGYYFIKNETTRLSGEVGPGVVFEKTFDKTGHRESKTYATVRFAERLDHKFNEKTKLWQSLEFLPQVDRWGNWVAIGEIGIDTALSKKLSLRPYIRDTYDNEPAKGRLKNDFMFVTSIAYKF